MQFLWKTLISKLLAPHPYLLMPPLKSFIFGFFFAPLMILLEFSTLVKKLFMMSTTVHNDIIKAANILFYINYIFFCQSAANF